jgi:hypothetical protein
LGLLFSSCSEDDDNRLLFSKGKVEVIVGKSDTVSIRGKNGSYMAISSDNKIATVKVSKTEIIITGVKKGITTIKVKSKSGKIGAIIVSVIDDLIDDPNKEVKDNAKIRPVRDKLKKGR